MYGLFGSFKQQLNNFPNFITILRPTSIKRSEDALALDVIWDDGHVSHYPLELLRRECPCAACKGETIFGKVMMPASLPVFRAGMNELESLTPTGLYGIQARWKDGHDTGIYSWEYLRMICPCPEDSLMRIEQLGEE
jgi:DUF971 family protein